MSVSDHLSAVSSCLSSASNPSWARTCRCNRKLEDPRRRLRGRLGGARSRCDRWGCPPCPPPSPSVTLHCTVEMAFKPKWFCNRLENKSRNCTYVHTSIWASQEFSLKWVQFPADEKRPSVLLRSRRGERREKRTKKHKHPPTAY